MRKPDVAKTAAKAKALALEFFQSDDWRMRFLAVYYLQFYMNPREIMKFLNTNPSTVLDNLMALKKIRRQPGLIKAPSLTHVLEAPDPIKEPQIRKARVPN